MKMKLMQILQKIMECNNVNLKVLPESKYAMENFNPYCMFCCEQEYKQYPAAWIKYIVPYPWPFSGIYRGGKRACIHHGQQSRPRPV